MGFINFGNRIKHRSFDYIPRYYDAEKEERERLVRMYGADSDSATKRAQDRIKSGFRSKYRAKEDAYSNKAKKRSNRILLYVMILMLIVCYIFLTEYLPGIAAQFGDK